MTVGLTVAIIVAVILATLIAFGDFYARMLQLRLSGEKQQPAPPVEQCVLQGMLVCAECRASLPVSTTIKGVGMTALVALDPPLKNALLMKAASADLAKAGWCVESERAICPSCTRRTS